MYEVFNPPVGSKIPMPNHLICKPFDKVSYNKDGQLKIANVGDWVIGIAQISHIQIIIPFKL